MPAPQNVPELCTTGQGPCSVSVKSKCDCTQEGTESKKQVGGTGQGPISSHCGSAPASCCRCWLHFWAWLMPVPTTFKFKMEFRCPWAPLSQEPSPVRWAAARGARPWGIPHKVMGASLNVKPIVFSSLTLSGPKHLEG